MAQQEWFTEPEAAEYCRCSFRAFRDMHLPAKNSGGRKVYNRGILDSALHSRPWQPSTVVRAKMVPSRDGGFIECARPNASDDGCLYFTHWMPIPEAPK